MACKPEKGSADHRIKRKSLCSVFTGPNSQLDPTKRYRGKQMQLESDMGKVADGRRFLGLPTTFSLTHQ